MATATQVGLTTEWIVDFGSYTVNVWGNDTWVEADAIAAATESSTGELDDDATAAAAIPSKFSYATRADFVTAMATETFVDGDRVNADGLTYLYDSGTDITDLPGFTPDGEANLNHFRASAAAAATDIGFADAIAWLNAGGRTLHLPSGNINTASPWPKITGDDATIVAYGSKVLRQSGSSGAFLILGDGATRCSRFNLIGYPVFQCNNTPGVNDFAVDIENSADFILECHPINVASIIRAGSVNGSANRGAIRFARGASFNKGLNSDSNILVQNAANLTFSGAPVAGGVANTNANGALFRIKPLAGKEVDTIFINDLTMQAFSDSTPGSSDGKPYGLVLDATDGGIQNIIANTGAVFDHTTVIGVHILDGAASNDTMRNIDFSGMRIATDAGQSVVIDKQSASTVAWRGIRFRGCHIDQVDADNAVEITGDGYGSCILTGSDIVDSVPGNTKPAAIAAGSDGWAFTCNAIGGNQFTGSGFTTGIAVTNTAITELRVDCNLVSADVTNIVTEPTYDGASDRRIVNASG